MSLYDWLQAGGGAALLLMTLVQIAPIKINPWSAVSKRHRKDHEQGHDGQTGIS